MRVLSVDRRRARRAREYLAVQLGIAQFVALAAVVTAGELLPGADQSHAPVAFSCAGLALAYAALQATVPAKRSLLWLFPFGSGVYIVLASGAIAATGGASSPIRVLLIFSVVYGAWFYESRPAICILAAVMVATLLPLAYDSQGFSAGPLGMTVSLSAVLLVGSVLTILGRVELTRLRDAARRDANRDPLTNLANRRALIRTLEKLCAGRRSADRFGLVFLDLDGFKEINTRLGHAGGDAALRTVACALRVAAREEDRVARIAGDEFAVVAPGVSSDGLRDLAQRLVRAVEGAVGTDLILERAGVCVRASAGAARWPQDATDPDSLLHAADLALLAAKRAGKGCVMTAGEDRAALSGASRAASEGTSRTSVARSS
jgi:diguanylate cyclase (GGDEF)-like protein